ncbi:MAG TPA: hypothetical protein VK836_14445 [Streptosporangiaceae bacterium]|nr:hypothetical protein [Streptosporangiaceae bacterium]
MRAALMYRAVGDFSLYWAGSEAAFLALDKRQQQRDRAAWTQIYLSVSREQYPSIWQVRTLLPEVQDDDIFEAILATVVAGLRQQAPHPCDCHAQAGVPEAPGFASAAQAPRPRAAAADTPRPVSGTARRSGRRAP